MNQPARCCASTSLVSINLLFGFSETAALAAESQIIHFSGVITTNQQGSSMIETYIPDTDYAKLVAALANLAPCPMAGRVTEDQINRAWPGRRYLAREH